MKFKIIPVICCVWMGCTPGMVRAQLPALKISENHCYLVTQDGNPFFWLGDTAIHRSGKWSAAITIKHR